MKMAEKRLNAEKKIDSQYFNLKMGTVNRLNPKAVYIEGKAFITPSEEMDDYAYSVNLSKKSFKTSISRSLMNSNIFDRNFIVDFDVAIGGIKVGKHSFLSFQVLFKQKNENPILLKSLKPLVEPMILSITNDLGKAMYNNGFSISKKKS